MKPDRQIILLVEDDPNDQFMIVRGFRANGVTDPIFVLKDGLEAIEYLRGRGQYANREKYPYPTLIITDLKMPGADGFTVLEHLKSHPQWKIIPTIVLTASGDTDDIKKAYMLGASSYHVKSPDLRGQMRLIYEYWTTCEIPEVDVTGKQLTTQSRGKLGERFEEKT